MDRVALQCSQLLTMIVDLVCCPQEIVLNLGVVNLSQTIPGLPFLHPVLKILPKERSRNVEVIGRGRINSLNGFEARKGDMTKQEITPSICNSSSLEFNWSCCQISNPLDSPVKFSWVDG